MFQIKKRGQKLFDAFDMRWLFYFIDDFLIFKTFIILTGLGTEFQSFDGLISSYMQCWINALMQIFKSNISSLINFDGHYIYYSLF